MTIEDEAIGALCAYRENRSGGSAGMQSVLNVLMNRAAKRGTSVSEEALRPWQFSSMTALADPQLAKGPNTTEPADIASYILAFTLAASAAAGTLEDITQGATSYYAASSPTVPSWAASMTQTVAISGQIFFR